MYSILDEPSIGLHQRDNERLIKFSQNLRDIGNSVLVVEHDKDMILEADYVLDIGPRAREIRWRNSLARKTKRFSKSDTITADYLTGKEI